MTDLIVDGNSLFARAFYASMRTEKLAELEGMEQPDNPLMLSVKMVLGLLDPLHSRLETRVDRTLFCWDGKAKREKRRPVEKPESYDVYLKQFIDALGLLFSSANARSSEHEADDAVATAVYRANPDDTVIVVSGDKDLQQLHSGNVYYYCLQEGQRLSREFITERWHVKRPSQICIALAILGDPGDNIPGIRGWGPKKVEKLFEAVDSDMDLERVLEVVEGQMPHDKLAEFRESLEYTVLDPDVPGVPEPNSVVFAPPQVLKSLGLGILNGRFLSVKNSYERGPQSDAEVNDMDMIER
jgi:DNA polymerase-1